MNKKYSFLKTSVLALLLILTLSLSGGKGCAGGKKAPSEIASDSSGVFSKETSYEQEITENTDDESDADWADADDEQDYNVSDKEDTPPYTNIIAYGSFSEGRAFAYLSASEPCYIDSQGNPVILLPKGTFGYPFHDGCAVLVNETLHLVESSLNDFGPASCDYTYSLIDEEGNAIIPEGEYSLINSMSNGLSFAYRRVESYSGTTTEFSFIDSEGNVVVSLNPDDVGMINENEIWNWDEIAYNEAGYCSIMRRDYSGKNTISVFDRSGNLCFVSENPITGITIDPEYYFTVTSDSTRVKTLVVKYGSFQPAVSYSSSFCSDADFSPKVFCGDYTIGYKHGTYIAKYDNGGNLLSSNDLHCYKIIDSRDGYCVSELENGYYGVTDPDLQLVFEPVKEKISCMGNGFFLTKSGLVYQADGSLAFTWQPWWERCEDLSLATELHIPEIDPEFSEGWFIVYDYDLQKPVYVNERGEIAAFCGGTGVSDSTEQSSDNDFSSESTSTFSDSVSSQSSEISPADQNSAAEEAYQEIIATKQWKNDMYPGQDSVHGGTFIGSAYLYDIDRNGIHELIISYGSSHLFWQYGIYTYMDNQVCFLGMIDGTYNFVYGRSDGTGICVPDGAQGETWVYYMDIIDSMLCAVYDAGTGTFTHLLGSEDAFSDDYWDSNCWEILPVYDEITE